MGNKMQIRRIISVHIAPAVGSLFTEIVCAVGIVVCTCVSDRCCRLMTDIGDCSIKTAAVICIVGARVYDEIKTLEFFDFKIVDLNQGEVFFCDADRNDFEF